MYTHILSCKTFTAANAFVMFCVVFYVVLTSCGTISVLLPHRGSNSHPNPYVGHAASQLGVALPTLAQTALKPK